MDSQQRRHLEELRHRHQNRLRELELQEAQFGMHVPPHIRVEIKSIRETLTQIDDQLDSVKKIQISAPTSVANTLIIYSTNSKTTELRATKDGLELYLHDTKRRKDKGLRWTLPINDLKQILLRGQINVRPASSDPLLGFVDIGDHTDWYYSKNLFTNPKHLYDEICKLIELTIKLSDS